MNRVNIPGTSIFDKRFCYNNLFPSYSPNTASEGIQNSDEWAQVRKNELTKARHPQTNLRLLMYQEYRKIQSALNLLRKFDFSNVSKIGAIGDAPFIQSIVVIDKISSEKKISFLLTDFESISINFGKQLGLDNVNFAKFDLNSDSLDLFLECDVILMWGVDCLVEDATLLRLFDFCVKKKIALIIASINCEDQKLNWKRILRLQKLKHKFSKRKFGNLHAYYRTQKYFERLCLSLNVKSQVLFVDRIYRVFRIN